MPSCHVVRRWTPPPWPPGRTAFQAIQAVPQRSEINIASIKYRTITSYHILYYLIIFNITKKILLSYIIPAKCYASLRGSKQVPNRLRQRRRGCCFDLLCPAATGNLSRWHCGCCGTAPRHRIQGAAPDAIDEPTETAGEDQHCD